MELSDAKKWLKELRRKQTMADNGRTVAPMGGWEKEIEILSFLIAEVEKLCHLIETVANSDNLKFTTASHDTIRKLE